MCNPSVASSIRNPEVADSKAPTRRRRREGRAGFARAAVKEEAMEVTREIVFPDSPGEVWEALTDPEQLEEWFANDVELDAREGGDGVFRWDDGEERRAKVLVVEPGERLVLDWDDQGEVEFTLEEVEEGTRLLVRESTPEFSTALELRALALSYV
jgi:uncharacterized protein YndB with AHSA1/START domain